MKRRLIRESEVETRKEFWKSNALLIEGNHSMRNRIQKCHGITSRKFKG